MTELRRIPYKGGPLAGTLTPSYIEKPPETLIPENAEGYGAYHLYVTVEGTFVYQWRWAEKVGELMIQAGYEQVPWRVGRKVFVRSTPWSAKSLLTTTLSSE